MATETEPPISDKGRLVFGAGFAFGIACTMLILGVVLVSLGESMGTPTIVTVLAGVLFAGVVGAGLYFLAFPENRVLIPVGTEESDDLLGGRGSEPAAEQADDPSGE